MTDYDAIVIGAGHNGLVAASYLAKAGSKVLVLDVRGQPGGCASNRQLTEEVTVSDCAQWLGQFDRDIIKDLKLVEHGLLLGETKQTIALQADGNHLILEETDVSGVGLSADDQDAYRRFRKKMNRFAKLIVQLYKKRPPKLVDQNWHDRLTLLKLGLGLKLLGREDMRDLMRIALINIYDVLNEHFDHPGLKAALALDAVTGSTMGPRSPNTVFSYLHRVAGNQLGQQGLCQVLGGMGALGETLAQAAQSHGATIRLNSPVQSIMKEHDRVCGVKLDSGEQISAKIVMSSADPVTTFKTLLGYRHIETGMARRVEHYRTGSGTAKLHLVLSGLPEFSGLPATAMSHRLVIAPSMDAMESMLNPAKYGEVSDQQLFDISIPSIEDKTLVSDGSHILTSLVHYLPHSPKEGWDSLKPQVLARLLDQLEEYAPGIKSLVTSAELLTPADLEATFGIADGNWHHGELSIDQALMMRPFPGATQYQTPVRGLVLCGAGAHPGGGLMGLAGRNAAREILRGGHLS